MFDTMTKRQLEEECLARAIDTTGLTKQEMIRRLKTHERKARTQKEKGDCLEADVGEGEEEDENETIQADADERQMQLALIRAEERRFAAEAEVAKRKELTARAEADADERRAKSERERLEADKQRFEMELTLLREKAKMGLVQQNLTAGDAETVETNRNSIVKLPTMHENEDVISYFHSFEKIACLNNVDETHWSKMLPALLNSTMRAHYNRLSYEICNDYRRLKCELLKSCRMNSKFYWDKFKQMHRSGKESYAQFLARLRDMQEYYFQSKEINTFEELKNDILMERFKESLPSDTRYFVDARNPVNEVEVAKLADLHYECTLEAKKDNRFNKGNGSWQKFNDPEQNFDRNQTKPVENFVNWGGQKPHNGNNYNRQGHSQVDETGARTKGCFNCQASSHKIAQCPLLSRPQVNYISRKGPKDTLLQEYRRKFSIPMIVNNKRAYGLRDTASDITLISSDLARGKPLIRDRKLNVQSTFGQLKWLDACEIQIASLHFGSNSPVTIKAGIVKNLKVQIIIGNDLFIQNPELKDTVSACDHSSKVSPEAKNSEPKKPTSEDGGEEGKDRTLDHDPVKPDHMAEVMIVTRSGVHGQGSNTSEVPRVPRPTDEGDHTKLTTCPELNSMNREGEGEIKDSSLVMIEFDEETRSQKPVPADTDACGVTNDFKMIYTRTDESLNSGDLPLEAKEFQKTQRSDESLTAYQRSREDNESGYEENKRFLYKDKTEGKEPTNLVSAIKETDFENPMQKAQLLDENTCSETNELATMDTNADRRRTQKPLKFNSLPLEAEQPQKTQRDLLQDEAGLTKGTDARRQNGDNEKCSRETLSGGNIDDREKRNIEISSNIISKECTNIAINIESHLSPELQENLRELLAEFETKIVNKIGEPFEIQLSIHSTKDEKTASKSNKISESGRGWNYSPLKNMIEHKQTNVSNRPTQFKKSSELLSASPELNKLFRSCNEATGMG